MKGLVVVICAPSQRGKDFIATKTMEDLSLFDKKSSYATVYKVRKSRKNDEEHIKCVEHKDEITIAETDRLEATIYGSQTIANHLSKIGQTNFEYHQFDNEKHAFYFKYLYLFRLIPNN